MWQLKARGIVGYAPLVGTRFPLDLHVEDIAFYYTILTGFGTRRTAERASFTAARSVGGLQLASLVECVVSGVASEILFILKGNILASCIARDTLREGMLTDPDEVNNSLG